MFRRLITAASAFSLLACVATFVVWVRSYHVTDGIQWTFSDDAGIAADVSCGTVEVVQVKSLPRVVAELSAEGGTFDSPPPGVRYRRTIPSPTDRSWGIGAPEREWQGLGFVYRSGTQLFAYGRQWIVPLWFVAIFTALLPALLLRSMWMSRRRPSPHACLSCGYDLRASKERCPECGSRIPFEQKKPDVTSN